MDGPNPAQSLAFQQGIDNMTNQNAEQNIFQQALNEMTQKNLQTADRNVQGAQQI